MKGTETGLEWVSEPDVDTNWYDAKKWVENLSINGGGWRMPTKDELKTLYQKGKGICNMTSLLKTTGWNVWSGERRETWRSWSVWGFCFDGGWDRYWITRSDSGPRAFAVRSRK